MTSLMERIKHAAAKGGKLSWTTRFSALSVILILVFVLVFHQSLGLDNLAGEGQIGIATILGLLGMIAVSVGLMAAVFYSSRSGMDDEAHDAHDTRREKDPPES